MKDKKIVEHTEIIVARKSENSVCGMPVCVCLLKPAVSQRALRSAGRGSLASHGSDVTECVRSGESLKQIFIQVTVSTKQCENTQLQFYQDEKYTSTDSCSDS